MKDAVALLCSGQGSQRPGMAADLVERCPGASALLERADDALGWSLSRMMLDPEAGDALGLTANAQPAILAYTVAQAQTLESAGIEFHAAAGHSLGQYSALVVAGALTFEEAVRLVHLRGRLMQETVAVGTGSMMVILGMERALVEDACRRFESQGAISVACFNSPNEQVVSGELELVERLSDELDEEGASVVPLQVSAPFHCSLLQPMLDEFEDALAEVAVGVPRFPVVDNTTAKEVSDPSGIRAALAQQITAPVRFDESLQHLLSLGVRAWFHCGPERKTMRRWLGAIDDEATVVHFDRWSETRDA